MSPNTNHRCPKGSGCQGFTLIELIVVITLIGVMMFFAVPRLNTSLLTSDSRKVSKWMVLTVKKLKEKSVREQTPHVLRVDLDNHKLTCAAEMEKPEVPDEMEAFAELSAEEKQAGPIEELELPDGFRLSEVEFPGKTPISSGTAEIRFYSKGYSDHALIHLEDDASERLTFEIAPFLHQVQIHERDVDF